MSVKTVDVIGHYLTCQLFFSDRVKRIDIRRKRDGLWTQSGVSLTASEFRFCLNYVKNIGFQPLPEQFYNLSIERFNYEAVKISKIGRSVICEVRFWRQLEPLALALTYLITEQSLPKMVLLDLDMISQELPEDTVLACDWLNRELTKGNANDSFLSALGLLEPEEVKNRKFDPSSLLQFAESNKDRFFSLVRFMYTYKRVSNEN